MAQKRNLGVGGSTASPSMTVAEYSRQFFDRVLRKSYGTSEEENVTIAGQKFCTLVKKLQDAASKDDVKVTLRVLRDEIGRVYFASGESKKLQKIEMLFLMYDALEADCQESMKGLGRGGQQAALLLAELRDRFTRLAVGETWETFPELRLLALKRIQKYAVQENEQLRLRGKLGIDGLTVSGGSKGAMGKRFQAIAMGPSQSDTWQEVLNNLGKAASSKLVPLLKALLLESYTRESQDPAAASTEAVAEAAPEDASVPETPPPEARQLQSTASNISVADSGHKLSELNILDDLLGLNDPVPAAAPAGPPMDPFQLLAENGSAAVGTPVPGEQARNNVFSSTPIASPFSAQVGGSGSPSPFAAPAASPFAPVGAAASQGSLGVSSSVGTAGGTGVAPSVPAANPFGDMPAFAPPSSSIPPFQNPGYAGNMGGPFNMQAQFAAALPGVPGATGFAAMQPVGSGALGTLGGPAPAAPQLSGVGFEAAAFSAGFEDLVHAPFGKPGQANGPAGSAPPPLAVASPAGAAPLGFGESAFGPSTFDSKDPSPSPSTNPTSAAGGPVPANGMSSNPFFAPPPPGSQPAAQPFAW